MCTSFSFFNVDNCFYPKIKYLQGTIGSPLILETDSNGGVPLRINGLLRAMHSHIGITMSPGKSCKGSPISSSPYQNTETKVSIKSELAGVENGKCLLSVQKAIFF
jgi:hypothetical protein